MEKDDRPTFLDDLGVVLHGSPRKLDRVLPIMRSYDEMLRCSRQLCEDFGHMVWAASMRKIAEMPYLIVGPYDLIPAIDERIVHIGNAVERSIAKIDDVGMSGMMIGCEPDRHVISALTGARSPWCSARWPINIDMQYRNIEFFAISISILARLPVPKIDRPGRMPKTIRSPRHVRLLELAIEARREAGLTQVDVARRLSIVQSVLSLIERGGRRIDIVEFLEIADVLGLDPHRVLDELLKIRD